jgi:hypothetical protein
MGKIYFSPAYLVTELLKNFSKREIDSDERKLYL